MEPHKSWPLQSLPLLHLKEICCSLGHSYPGSLPRKLSAQYSQVKTMKVCSHFAPAILLGFSMNILLTKRFGGCSSEICTWEVFHGFIILFPSGMSSFKYYWKELCWILHKHKSPLSEATNLTQKLLDYKQEWYWSVLVKNEKNCSIAVRILLILFSIWNYVTFCKLDNMYVVTM